MYTVCITICYIFNVVVWSVSVNVYITILVDQMVNTFHVMELVYYCTMWIYVESTRMVSTIGPRERTVREREGAKSTTYSYTNTIIIR